VTHNTKRDGNKKLLYACAVYPGVFGAQRLCSRTVASQPVAKSARNAMFGDEFDYYEYEGYDQYDDYDASDNAVQSYFNEGYYGDYDYDDYDYEQYDDELYEDAQRNLVEAEKLFRLAKMNMMSARKERNRERGQY